MSFLRLFHQDRFRTIPPDFGSTRRKSAHLRTPGGKPRETQLLHTSLSWSALRPEQPHDRQGAPWWPEKVEISEHRMSQEASRRAADGRTLQVMGSRQPEVKVEQM